MAATFSGPWLFTTAKPDAAKNNIGEDRMVAASCTNEWTTM
jgi:hypothetical protein